MEITAELLVLSYGISAAKAEQWVVPFTGAAHFARLNNVARLSAFIGQCGHESGRLKWLTELWGPTPAQRRYEGRADLGNRLPGDGFRYRGRGPIQTTGRRNFARARDRLRERMGDRVPDFEMHPFMLSEPLWGILAAADYWLDHDLNTPADRGDQLTVTRRVNGGTNGLADRLALTAQARAACILTGVFS